MDLEAQEINKLNLKPFLNVIDELKMFLNTNNLKYKNLEESEIAISKNFINTFKDRLLYELSEDELISWYKTLDDYIYENSYWSNHGTSRKRFYLYNKILKQNDINELLEISPGNGSNAIAFALNGYKVKVLKNNDLSFKFFEWRLKNIYKDIDIEIINNIEYSQCICHFDVIEHIKDYYKFAKWTCEYCDNMLFVHAFGVHKQELGGFPYHFDADVNSLYKYIEAKGFKKIKLIFGIPPIFFKRINKKME